MAASRYAFNALLQNQNATISRMTREDAIAAAPSSRLHYGVMLTFSFLALGGYVWILSSYPIQNLIIRYAGVISLFFCAAVVWQTMERIFFPERAFRRTMNFSAGRRERLLEVGTKLAWLFYCLTLLSVVLSIGRYFHMHSGSYAPFLLMQVSVQQFTRDLAGQKPEDSQEDFVHSPPLENLKPLSSDSWGKGSSHTII